jgi:glycosyltransferase involved in cell wall biosynthesis
MRVNFVISSDKSSRIFSDIFRRFIDSELMDVVISEHPVADCDIYHYHRPQMETALLPNSVVTVHHDLDDPDPFVLFSRFEERYREARYIVCLNTLQKTALTERGFTQTVIIPHGYDADLFKKRGTRVFDPSRKVRIGITSKRYGRRFKGEVLLYQLLERLPAHLISFILIGEGRSEDALRFDALGFEVECHEVFPYRLFPSAYDKMDLLLMCSTFEGGPANIPEAVATGTPVICTPIGMIPDMISDGTNGVYLTRNPEKDAQKIVDIVNNFNGIYDRLMVGANNIQDIITWDEVINKHHALYRSMSYSNAFSSIARTTDVRNIA